MRERRVTLVVAIVSLLSSAACSEEPADTDLTPTQADVPYVWHPRHVLDFWRADAPDPTPLFVWIHAGGFRRGSKEIYPQALISECLDAGISVASINYRLSRHSPYPAQMQDGARAIQFLRSKAEEWKIDSDRFAAGGSSAGAGIAQWIGFHDDMADPESANPVARESTRLASVLALQMQSTYDPRVIKRLVPGDAYQNSALKALFGLPDTWDWDTDEIGPELDDDLEEASPIQHLTADDPPVFIFHSEIDDEPGNIHHPNFGVFLKSEMDKLGISCLRRMDSDCASARPGCYPGMVEFLKKYFGML